MNERTCFFRKIYLSHFILDRVVKGLRKGRYWLWVSWRRNRLQHKTSSSSDYSSTSFSFCWAAQPGVTEGGKPSVWSWFLLPRTAPRTPTATDSNCNWLQLTQTVCGTRLYNCLTPICFLWPRNCTEFNPSISQGDTAISSTRCTYFLIDGWIESQYITHSRGNKSTNFLVFQSSEGVIYEDFWFDVTRGCMNWTPNVKQTHSGRFANLVW